MITMITDSIGIGDDVDARQLEPSIEATLNVAIDVDIPDAGRKVDRHKVGLINGSGNDDFALISSVLMLHSLSRKRYKRIMVHGNIEDTRSIMVVAVYISIIGNMNFDKVLSDIILARHTSGYNIVLHDQFVKLIPTISKFIKNN